MYAGSPLSKFGGVGVVEFSFWFSRRGMAGGSFFEFGGLVGERDAIFFRITGLSSPAHCVYFGVRFSPKSNHYGIIKSWRKGDAFCLDKPTKSLVCSGVLLGSSLEKYIMANKATQTVTAPVQSAVGSAVEMVAGRSLVEAQAALEDIFGATAEAEKLMEKGEAARDVADANLLDWLTQFESVDGKQVKARTAKLDMAGAPVLKEGKPVMVFVPIAYPEYLQVRSWAIAKYFDKGAPTTDAAERQWERQVNRLRVLGWQSPKAKTADAERMAKKRAEEAAKFAGKSDGELLEQKAELVAKGDTKSMTQATALQKEIERREKPEQDKLQADIKVLHDTLKKRASEWAKAGSVESLERLTNALMALG